MLKRSSWKRSQSDDPRGLPLLPQETFTPAGTLESYSRKDNISLTIPNLRFGRIGTLVVTKCRLVFLVAGQPEAYELSVGDISSFQAARIGAGKITIKFCAQNEEQFSIQGLDQDILQLNTIFSTLAIGASTTKATGRKVKKVVAPPPSSTKVIVPTSAADGPIGLAKVVHGINADIDSRQRSLDAVGDINSLKESAQSLKVIAEDLAKMTDSESLSEVNKIIVALGLNEIAGSYIDPKTADYSKQIANQFAAAMAKVLPSYGNVLSVAEAYMIFNRTRGSDFISPKDLKDAIAVIDSGDYSIKIEEIGTTARKKGRNEPIRVVLPKNVSFDSIVKEILSKFGESEYATPLIISKKTKLPSSIVSAYLERAEQQGILCRDESLAGLRFYRNIFGTFKLIDL